MRVFENLVFTSLFSLQVMGLLGFCSPCLPNPLSSLSAVAPPVVTAYCAPVWTTWVLPKHRPT